MDDIFDGDVLYVWLGYMVELCWVGLSCVFCMKKKESEKGRPFYHEEKKNCLTSYVIINHCDVRRRFRSMSYFP